MKDGYMEALKEAVQEQLGCASSVVSTEHFRETHDGNVVWDGDMVLFDLINHPTARQCYAWANEKDGKWHSVVVLKTPKTDSPKKAFWAFVLAHHA